MIRPPREVTEKQHSVPAPQIIQTVPIPFIRDNVNTELLQSMGVEGEKKFRMCKCHHQKLCQLPKAKHTLVRERFRKVRRKTEKMNQQDYLGLGRWSLASNYGD